MKSIQPSELFILIISDQLRFDLGSNKYVLWGHLGHEHLTNPSIVPTTASFKSRMRRVALAYILYYCSLKKIARSVRDTCRTYTRLLCLCHASKSLATFARSIHLYFEFSRGFRCSRRNGVGGFGHGNFVYVLLDVLLDKWHFTLLILWNLAGRVFESSFFA